MQGIDFCNGKPILYSLGNFWFDGSGVVHPAEYSEY